ncbi:hypothetical protein EB118_15455, partial [bacterium]|nr:hypothetical protein [bacterium]
MSTSTSIQASQFNAIQTRVAKLLGTGTGDFGYGQTLISSQILPGQKITAQPLVNIKIDLDKIAFHQTNLASAAPSVQLGQSIAATDWTKYTNELDLLEANRLQISETSAQSTWTADYSTLGFSNWNSVRAHTVTFDFGSINNARYFFNTGGEIRIVPRHTGFTNASSKGGAWAALFNRLGTKGVRLRANVTTCQDGTAESKGYYQLTTTPLQIFSIVDTGPYAGNDFVVLASVSNPLRSLIITCRFTDDTLVPATDEAVDGTTTSSLGILRATGSSVGILTNPVAQTNLNVPGSPLSVTATITGGTTATINYLPPSSDGGISISSYTAVSTPDNVTATVNREGGGQIFVTGLRPVTTYTFVVFATNTVGSGPNSSPTASVTTTTDVPSKPLSVTAVSTSSTTATITYSEPSSNGGTTIISYTAISSPGNIQATVTRSGGGTINVTGLSVATAYTFRVYATNSRGNSALSDPSELITTSSAEPIIGSPYGGGYFAGAVSTPGNDLADYFLIVSPASLGQSSTGLQWSNTSTVTSSTSVIDGRANSNSLPSTPQAPGIGLPAVVSGSLGTQIDISYTAPINNGGSAITSYTAISTPDNITSTVGRAGSGNIRVSNLSPNKTYSFKVYATNAVGNSPLSISTVELQTPILPNNTSIPSITGTVLLGSTLTVDIGTWTGTPTITYSYQWQRGTVSITGSTSQTYTIVIADVGSILRCVITASNAAGTKSVNSAYTIAVPAIAPTNSSLPTISGTVQVGQTLTVSNGVWSGSTPITYEYQWQRGTTNITGSTSTSYTIVLTDVGNRFRVRVLARNSAGENFVFTASTALVPSVAPTNTSLPVITGDIAVGLRINATTGVWTGSPTIQYTYQWLRNSTPISGSTTNGYTILASDVGSVLSVEVKASNNAGFDIARSLPTATIQSASAPTISVLPAITGNAAVDQILNVSNGTWSGTQPINYAYQWLRGTISIVGATSNNYTVTIADTLNTIACKVTASNVSGSLAVTSASTGQVPAVLATNVILPVITGTVEIGKTIQSSTGTWTGTPTITYSYQWQRGTTNISGANTSSYTIQLADSNSQLRCQVIASNPAGLSQAANSLSTITVPLPSVPVNSIPPSISGTVSVGNTLTTSNGTWTGTGPFTYTYQWQSGNVDLAGKITNTYIVDLSDVGKTIRVVVTATNASGNRSSASLPTVVVPPTAPILVSKPVVTGIVQIGETLTTTDGSWIGSPTITYTYQWLRGNSANAISGATSSTYKIVTQDANNQLYVRVTARNSVGSRSDTSLGTSVVPLATAPVNVVAPTITGTVAIGETLTINLGTWTGTPTINYTYQWQRGSTNITNATATTYVIAGEDTGSTIRCRVSASNSAGNSQPAFTLSTPPIAAAAPTNRVLPVITGTLAIGQNLTVNPGTWIGTTPITYTYQWEQNTTPIAGATNNVYVIRLADNNNSLRCGVTASNSVGNLKVYSEPTNVISAVAPANTAEPTILGIPAVGQTLSVNVGSWTGTQPITYQYQWKRGTSN